MKKIVEELKKKDFNLIKKEIQKLKEEIAKLILENKAHPKKDTNIIKKMRKKLAIMLTVLTEKQSK